MLRARRVLKVPKAPQVSCAPQASQAFRVPLVPRALKVLRASRVPQVPKACKVHQACQLVPRALPSWVDKLRFLVRA